MNFKPMYAPGAILVMALWMYFHHFNYSLSDEQAVWGAFGDFIGGILNPVLTFTTVYLLIKSLDSQSKTLEHSQSQLDEAKRTFGLQEKTENIKQFESLYFVFTEIASQSYSSFSINGRNDVVSGHQAVTEIFYMLMMAKQLGNKTSKVFESIDEDNHDAIYSVVQAYCSLFKIIDEFCPLDEKDKYVSVSISLIPSKAIHLMCMAAIYTKWPVLEPVKKLGFFDKPAMAELKAKLPV